MAEEKFSPWLPLGGLAERITAVLSRILREKTDLLDRADCRLLEEGVKFLDTVAEGIERVEDFKFLSAPIETLDKFKNASEVFERMNVAGKNLADVIKMSRDSLAALLEGEKPKEISKGLEMAERFFRTFRDVALEHLAVPLCGRGCP